MSEFAGLKAPYEPVEEPEVGSHTPGRRTRAIVGGGVALAIAAASGVFFLTQGGADAADDAAFPVAPRHTPSASPSTPPSATSTPRMTAVAAAGRDPFAKLAAESLATSSAGSTGSSGSTGSAGSTGSSGTSAGSGTTISSLGTLPPASTSSATSPHVSVPTVTVTVTSKPAATHRVTVSGVDTNAMTADVKVGSRTYRDVAVGRTFATDYVLIAIVGNVAVVDYLKDKVPFPSDIPVGEHLDF